MISSSIEIKYNEKLRSNKKYNLIMVKPFIFFYL